MTVMVVKPWSEQLRPEQGIDEVEHEPRGHQASERIVEDHGTSPLQSVAGDGVTHRQCEEGEADRQHDEVHHLHAPERQAEYDTLIYTDSRCINFDLHQERELFHLV